MKIITVTNRKGGVGKSTMASHLAAGLALKGYRVGLVDTDSQGNASMMLGIQAEDGLFNLLIQKQPLTEVVRYVPKENYGTPKTQGHLLIVPSSERTYQIPYMLKQDESFLFLETLEAMAQHYQLDYILIDTNPSLSLFDASVYLAADGFIYVTECESMSLQGVKKAFEQMQRFSQQRRKYLHRETRILGIIPNKYRARTLIHQRNVAALQKAFGELVWPPQTLRTIWAEASNYFQPIYLIAPDSEAAHDMLALVDRMEEGLMAWEETAGSEKKI